MTNNLIEELFFQISKLEQQNHKLEAELETTNTEKSLVCRYTQFQTWPKFMSWVARQYEATDEIPSSGRESLGQEGCIDTINELVSTPTRQPLDSMKVSEILQEGIVMEKTSGTQRTFIKHSLSKTQQTRDVTFSKSKQQDIQLNDLECIVMENSRLRSRNNELQRQVDVYRENIRKLVNLVGLSFH